MKNIFLLCNAHLDPMWLWQWQEGAAETISTFRTAADFCEQYNGFVFNHNESILYEWIEEYEPQLFERIKKLVAEGKWRIMGGWYLQPDCTMLSGESFIRQISYGRKYFKEKFNKIPKTAINFDPFGHIRGLVQILKKTGYTSYLMMRGGNKDGNFIWKGFDGSEILTHKMQKSYNTPKGLAVDWLCDMLDRIPEVNDVLCPWGVGDHGGGPSRIDLENLNKYIEENKDKNIYHTYCEDFFAKIDKTGLETVDKSLVHCMVGCYTSMVRIKQAVRRVENKIEMCKRIVWQAGIKTDKKLMEKAEKNLMLAQFHDVLPGSMIKKAEEDALNILGFAERVCDEYIAKAFFKLCEGQRKGKNGEIPVLVYNPLPYAVEEDLEVEFQLEDQNWNENETTVAKVRDENGEYLLTQNEKEDCTFNLDWRRKVAFRAKLESMSINRFDLELERKVDFVRVKNADETEKYFVFENDRMSVKINKKTGLIDEYKVDGKNLLNKSSCCLEVFNDNEDPWGMTVDSFNDKCGKFKLMSDADADEYIGYSDAGNKNVKIIENGEVRAKIQALFEYGRSVATVTYTIPKKDIYVDIEVNIMSGDVNKLYKLSFDTDIENGEFKGQTAFGTEEILKGDKEITFHKWCGMENANKKIYLINIGTYAGSASDNIMKVTLLRTPVYSAHPMPERQIAPHDRMHSHIDMGERILKYRLTAEYADYEAEKFNMPPFVEPFFPSGEGEKIAKNIKLSNKTVILTTLQENEGETLFRLYNTLNEKNEVQIIVLGEKHNIKLGSFEVKTFVEEDGKITETDMLGN